MATKVYIDGIPYTVTDEEAGNRLKADLAAGEGPLASKHQSSVAASQQRALASVESMAEEEETRRAKAEAKKSGASRALLAGMSNDQAYQMHWLAEKRFPELADDMNLSDLYFLDEDDEIAYLDPYTGKIQKEFKDSIFGDAMDTFGLVGPALQFVPELLGGAVGMTAGAVTTLPGGGLPGAVIGGASGTATGGSVGAAARAGISAAFDGPPLNVGQLSNDLMLSSAFGSIPIGPGFIRGARPLLNKVSTEFPGEDGANMLRILLTEGGDSVDNMIAMAQDRFGITLTRAEAQGLRSNAGQVQRYLQAQPSSQKLFDFYNDRALQMEDTLNAFFDEIAEGKLMTGKVGETLQEMGPRGGTAFDEDLTQASQNVLKKLLEERKRRATKIYDEAFKLSEEEGLAVDISAIGDKIKAMVDDPTTGKRMRKLMSQALETITDPTTGAYKSDLRALHNAVTQDLSPLYEGVMRKGQKSLAGPLAGFKGEITDAMKIANPVYGRATKVYSADTGHLQILERSLVNSLAKAAETGGSGALPLIQRMFTGKAKPAELRQLRELIQEEDPTVWQNLKANWLRTQLDDVIMSTKDPFGVPNKFLSRIGISNPKRAFQVGRRGEQQRAGKIAAFEEILGPEEFVAFKDALEVAQAVSYIATQGGSPTQPLMATMRAMEREASGLSRPVFTALRSLIEIPQRLVVRGFDDMSQSAINFQREAYEDSLIRAIIDPEYALEMRAGLDAINPFIYLATQSAVRGVPMLEAMEPTEFDERGMPTQMGEENLDLRQRMRELEDQTQAPSAMALPEFDPLPMTPMPQASPMNFSPALLPNENDRQIAMRQQGIAGLV
jgi:hypothetical protein